MKKIALSFLFVISNSFAIECPKSILSCEHKVLTEAGYYKTVETKNVEFIGINDDEPSLPANACEVYLTFDSMIKGQSINVSSNEDLTTYLYAFKNTGVVGPQFMLEATTGKKFSLSLHQETLECLFK